MSGNNGEKKPLPDFKEEWKDCFIHVALKIIESLSGQGAQICIKPEALEDFPEQEKPLFVWDNRKGCWVALNPTKEEPTIVTPSRGLILPPGS